MPTNASITIPTNPNFTLARIQALVNMQERLEDRTQCSVDEFVNALDMRCAYMNNEYMCNEVYCYSSCATCMSHVYPIEQTAVLPV